MTKNKSFSSIGDLANSIHYRAVMDTLPDYIFLKDLDGAYIACNKACEQFFGLQEEAIIGKTDYDFVPPRIAECFIKNDKLAIEAGKPVKNEEWVILAADNSRILVETTKTPMYDDKGILLGILGIARDITAHRELEEQLKAANTHLATLVELDSLTQIGNRRAYDTRLLQEWHFCHREQRSLALLILDIDYFKQYNDTYGHKAGDDCLVAVSQFLKDNRFLRRAQDGVFRIGGEEFALILSDCKPDYAYSTAEKIVKAVEDELCIVHEKNFFTNLTSQYLTVSVGIGCFVPEQHLSTGQLFNLADKALYQVKQQGRNGCALHTEQHL